MKKGIGTEDIEAPDLAVPLPTVCFIIFKARELDAKEEVSEPDTGSNPSDDREISVLEDRPDDPVEEELVSLISELDEDAQIDLVALMWLGRDDSTAQDWPGLRQQAADAHNRHTARYLCGSPLLADYLSAGLDLLGLSCGDYEKDHL